MKSTSITVRHNPTWTNDTVPRPIYPPTTPFKNYIPAKQSPEWPSCTDNLYTTKDSALEVGTQETKNCTPSLVDTNTNWKLPPQHSRTRKSPIAPWTNTVKTALVVVRLPRYRACPFVVSSVRPRTYDTNLSTDAGQRRSLSVGRPDPCRPRKYQR